MANLHRFICTSSLDIVFFKTSSKLHFNSSSYAFNKLTGSINVMVLLVLLGSNEHFWISISSIKLMYSPGFSSLSVIKTGAPKSRLKNYNISSFTLYPPQELLYARCRIFSRSSAITSWAVIHIVFLEKAHGKQFQYSI